MYRLHPAGRLPFPGRLQHPLKVIIRCSGKGVSNGVDLLDDGVFTRHDQSSFTNSIGVQMTGGSKPVARQIPSILPRMVALAM